MKAPLGFAKNGVDALMYRNASQYILIFLYLVGIYGVLKLLHIAFIKAREGKPKNLVDKIFSKIVGIFEYQVFMGGVAASYLNFTVYCYL
jgi:hypothetical protein